MKGVVPVVEGSNLPAQEWSVKVPGPNDTVAESEGKDLDAERASYSKEQQADGMWNWHEA